jgi:hypothetical protein
MDIINANTNVGRTKGMVIENKILGFDAPSIFAASVMDGETADNPANNMIIDIPKVFQATETLIMSLADHVDPSQFLPFEIRCNVLKM